MCPAVKKQFSFILNQLFSDSARIQKGFLIQFKVQSVFAKKTQKNWDTGSALEPGAVVAFWLNKLFVS